MEVSNRQAHKRRQAHLPDHELIKVALVISSGKGFQRKTIEEVRESQGPEGGLAPALMAQLEDFLCKALSEQGE